MGREEFQRGDGKRAQNKQINKPARQTNKKKKPERK